MNNSSLLSNGFNEFFGMEIQDLLSYFGDGYNIEETQLIPNSVSGKYSKTLTAVYGCNAFPFHTDGAHRVIPPRWTILEFIGDGKSETATLLFDSKALSQLKENEDLFHHEIYLVQNGQHSFLTSLINKQLHSEPIFRWNKLVMKKLFNKTNKTLDDCLSSNYFRVTWCTGKILVLDNWRMLHSREKLLLDEELTRKIKRYNLTPIKENASFRL